MQGLYWRKEKRKNNRQFLGLWQFLEVYKKVLLQYLFYMLQKDETTVPLNPPMLKILCASVAYKNTFVVLRMDKSNQESTIVHLDKNGKILYERKYKDATDSFGMINEKEVIITNVSENRIDIINLEQHNVRHVNHQYLFENDRSKKIITFSETRLFCVVYFGGLSDPHLRLTYYQYEGIKNDSKPQVEWESKDKEWKPQHHIEKMNNHSKIGWWRYNHQKEVTFTYFDLRSDPKGSLTVVSTKSQLDALYQVNGILLGISYLWEIKPDIYQLVAFSNKFLFKDKCKDKNGVWNDNYIIDASVSKDSASFRETRYIFEIQKDGFMYNDRLIDCFGIGNISVFHTFRHKDGKLLTTPVYYVNNETEEIIFQETWESIVHNSHFFFPGWDGSCVVQATHKNGDCEKITFRYYHPKFLDYQEISLFLLLGLNEDFDDDLLQDACELLSKQETQI